VKWVDEWPRVDGLARIRSHDEGTFLKGGEGRSSIVDSSTRWADPEKIFLTHRQSEEARGGSTWNEQASA
jgi:hypothetical protein